MSSLVPSRVVLTYKDTAAVFSLPFHTANCPIRLAVRLFANSDSTTHDSPTASPASDQDHQPPVRCHPSNQGRCSPLRQRALPWLAGSRTTTSTTPPRRRPQGLQRPLQRPLPLRSTQLTGSHLAHRYHWMPGWLVAGAFHRLQVRARRLVDTAPTMEETCHIIAYPAGSERFCLREEP